MIKAWRRLKSYLKHDFRELVNPSSLPNPPDYVPPDKVAWKEHAKVIQEGNRRYWKSWQADKEDKEELNSLRDKTQDPSLKDELSQTARSAMEKGQGLKPLLHHIYETRARSYRDAVQEFIAGYKEGYIGQPAAKTDDLKTSDNELKHSKPKIENP